MAFYDGFVLWLVHLILHIKTLIYTWLFCSWKPVDSLYRKVAYSRCCNDSKSLQKLPIHLGLVIVENKISYADISSIIVWSMAVGISYISVFDSRGILKKSHASLSRQIEKKQAELFGNEKAKYTYQIYHPQASTVAGTGISSSRKNRSHILLLSAQDGRTDIVQAAKDCCQQVYDQLTKSSTIDVPLIDSLLQATSGFPDPDLVIRFGSTSSLMGYLPWQIRLTEILSIPTHWNVDYKSFIATLHNYAGTRQRYGK